MERVHDVGGQRTAGPIDRSEHELFWWEKKIDAVMRVLASPEKRIMHVDELRRAMECITAEDYERLSYYERWLVAMEALMVEKGLMTREEIDRIMEKPRDA